MIPLLVEGPWRDLGEGRGYVMERLPGGGWQAGRLERGTTRL